MIPTRKRDRVQLQRRLLPAQYDDAETFQTFATVSADFRVSGGREFREGTVAVGETRSTFTVAYRANLTQVDRVVHLGRGGNRIYDVVSIAPTRDYKAGIDINCRTVEP